jgi:hypothetical protein
MDQQRRRRDPAIVSIEMAGMFAAAVQFGEQLFDFVKHGDPTARSFLTWRSLHCPACGREPYGCPARR